MKLSEPNMVKMIGCFVPDAGKLIRIRDGANSTLEALQNAFIHNLTLTFYDEAKQKNIYDQLIDWVKTHSIKLQLANASSRMGD